MSHEGKIALVAFFSVLLLYLASFGPALSLARGHATWTRVNNALYAPIWRLDMLLEGHNGPGPVLQSYLQLWGVYFKVALDSEGDRAERDV